MAKPDSKEIELLSQFRTRLADLNLAGRHNEDYDLVRWIRARNHNLNEAEKMIREHMKWRKEHDIENIFDWKPPERFAKDLPFEFLGYDDDNAPVFLSSFGKWDFKKIVELGEREAFVCYCNQITALIVKKMEGRFTRDGYPVTQYVSITDMKGMSYKTLASLEAIEILMHLTRSFEANQPEMLKITFQINANAVFAAIYALAKPIMSAATVSKLKVFSSDESKWRPVLHSHIPISILPPSLGGTNVNSILNETIAEIIEEEPEAEESPFLDVYIPAGGKLELCFGVEEGNSTIDWAFKTEKYDIAFAVNCDGKAYIEKNRVNSHEELQEGVITCETPGDYIFTYDNTYSRMRVKQLTYRVDVRTPSGLKHISF